MTATPVEANVVLTADNSQYDQAMMQSAGSTNNLGSAVDGLGKKINTLTKTAGKALIGITAADVALITGATAAWSSYEKQMSRLQAQAAITQRTQNQEQRTMKDYTAAVKTLRTEYGSTTGEAAKLVQTLGKLTDTKATRSLTDLGKVFTDMSHATGESSEGLASSLGNLQKMMGRDLSNTSVTRKYADMYTYLAAQTNSSAQGLIDFTAQLTPLGQQMGLNQKEIAGFATAFTKAGADGGAAATVFAKVTSDITKSMTSGSSEIKTYANLVGVTADEFKKMDSAEQIVQIMEALQKQGDGAISTLNRLGLDGPKSIRSITQMISQAGGVRQALGMAETGYQSDAAHEGEKASLRGLSDEFSKLREEMMQTAEAMASILGPSIEKVMGVFVKLMGVVQTIAEGPIGEFLQVIMAIAVPLTSGAGALLLFAGALLKVAAAFALVRNSAALGAREGLKGGAGITRGPEGYQARGGGMLGPRGAQLASDPKSSWLQRGMYNVGQAGGAGVSGVFGGMREAYITGREMHDPKYQAGPPRGPLSYAAGGLGRGIQQFITPQFDQMRYSNPADRRTWLAHEAPWTRAMDRSRLAGQMGQVGKAESDLRSVRQAEMGARTDPLLTNQERAERLENLKTIREETKHRLNSARASERTTREYVNQQAAGARLRAGTDDTSKGMGRLTRAIGGLGGGMGGGLLNAAGVGLKGAAKSGALGAGAGMLGMGALAATGVDSNALMMGAMGATIGPWGAAGGFALGGAIDMAQANNKVDEQVKLLNDQAEAVGKSGAGLFDLQEEADKTSKAVDDLDESFNRNQFFGMVTNPKAFFGESKNIWEDIWGASDIEELERDNKKAQDAMGDTEQSIRAMAEAAGVEVSGTRNNQLQQLETYITGEGAAQLSAAGVDLEDLPDSRKRLGAEGFDALIASIAAPRSQGEDLSQRLMGTDVGKAMLTNPMAQRALEYEEDIGLQYQAQASVYRSMRDQGKSNLDILIGAEKAQAEAGNETEVEYQFAEHQAQRAQQNIAIGASVGTRVEGFQTQIDMQRRMNTVTPQTGPDFAQRDAMKQQTASAIADQVNYFKQLLLAQDQYELGRQRAQEDYNLQRMYQEHDFNLQRSRAEENFQRMRRRATADFNRQERRAYADFHRQRTRAEEDFNHQVSIMAKQQATGIYNIYERVQAQRTSSAEWLLSNAGDQLARMREQSENLDKLRAAGMSNAAIQQMKFTDPQQAQQLARFVTEMTPQLITQFNKVAGRERVKAAKDIVTDPSSLEWGEMRRGHKLAMGRNAEDFERGMRNSRKDFKRGMNEQKDDFNLMMDQQLADFDTQTERQENQYKKTMDRAAEDMANMANEINLSMEEVLVESTKRLSGSAKTQATAVLKSFQDLKKDTSPEAVAMMQELADIFGFEYKIPKAARQTMHSVQQDAMASKRSALDNRAEGGTIPGWSPGRDVTTVNVSGGEAVMRPEWTRAVGEKAIDAMNHKAKYGGFASGGVFWPVPGRTTSTYAGHDGVDINRGSGSDDMGDPIRAFRSGKIVYVGSGRGYGQAIFERTAAGTVVYGHTSAQSVHAGQMVNAGQLIGNVGSTGNSSAPHLHFGIPGGTYQQALQLLQGSMIGGGTFLGGAMVGAGATPSAMLKSWYPKSEHSAYNMKGAHPLDPGMITQVINRFARRKIRNLGGIAESDSADSIGREPSGHLNNEQIVRTAARRMGWGDQWSMLRQLVMHESGFNNTAQNPTSSAYGMFQFLNSTWPSYGVRKTSDPWKQTQAGMKYIKGRYGDPRGAWDFWQDHNWYKDGSVFDGAQTIGVGENGPEAVIPLNARGADFMTDVMGNIMGGRNTTPMRGGMSVYNTKIDRSTNFTGPITVQANNPAELLHKLQARQRVMALSRPSLTGSAA